MNTDTALLEPKQDAKTETRFLDPTNDVAFKRIFENKARLLDFLNALLEKRIGAKIVIIYPISIEELPDIGDGKRSLFDIKVKDETGQNYIIEMQRSNDSYFKSRVQCYGAHTLVSMIRKGEAEPYSNVTPVIVIAINNTNLFDDNRVPCVSFHRTIEEDSCECHLHLIRYLFIELKKFNKTAEELSTVVDQWLFFFKNWKFLKAPPETIKDQFVKEAYKEIERFNWTSEQYDAYFRSEMAYWQVEENLSDRYKRGKADGKAEVARSMLAEGIDINFIMKVTGFTADYIEKLKPS